MGIFLYIIKCTMATDVDQAITAAAELPMKDQVIGMSEKNVRAVCVEGAK